jgi:hypothetical protein
MISGIDSLFSFAHTQWVWDLKTDPRWVEAFERVWGTKELLGVYLPFADAYGTSSNKWNSIVSFDGGNLSIPLSAEEIARREPWHHTDQSPLRPDMYCIQSLINLVSSLPEYRFCILILNVPTVAEC